MRRQAIHDIVARTFVAAAVPATKEPTGLSRTDGKRPDGLTLIPWQGGKPLTWDVTITSTLASSYLMAASAGSACVVAAAAAAGSAGATAELAVARKCAKYINLPASYIFQPIAFENLGPINSSAVDFISELGRSHLHWPTRFKASLLHDSFVPPSEEPDQLVITVVAFYICFWYEEKRTITVFITSLGLLWC